MPLANVLHIEEDGLSVSSSITEKMRYQIALDANKIHILQIKQILAEYYAITNEGWGYESYLFLIYVAELLSFERLATNDQL